jgi:hypothetical protein
VAWVHAFPDCLHDPVPLPRAKPLTSGTAYPPSMVPMPPALPLHDFEAWPSDCGLRLAEIARFAPQPSLNGPGQCGAADLVRLEEVTMTNSAPVRILPPATLRCSMAEAIARWVRNDLSSAMAELGSPPVALTNGGSYNCRGRNNDASAKISEHGRGNAFDLGPIKLANGAVMDLSNGVTPQSFRLHLREATCHRFNTVLGPGSDPYHVNHIHLDLAERARLTWWQRCRSRSLSRPRSRRPNWQSAQSKWRGPRVGFLEPPTGRGRKYFADWTSPSEARERTSCTI